MPRLLPGRTRIVIGRPRSVWRRLFDALFAPPPPPAWCARCGAIRAGDPNVSRLYGSRSHVECEGFYDFDPMNGQPPVPLCYSFRTYSM